MFQHLLTQLLEGATLNVVGVAVVIEQPVVPADIKAVSGSVTGSVTVAAPPSDSASTATAVDSSDITVSLSDA